MSRIVVLGVIAALAACNQPPVVEIGTPASGTLIQDHAPIAFSALVTDENLTSIRLELDGAEVPATVDPPLPTDGTVLACGAGCPFTLTWSGAEASEGDHVLGVIATDLDQAEGDATVAMRFEDVPTPVMAVPSGVDQLGVGMLGVTVSVVDRSQVASELLLDGVAQTGVTVLGDCRFGCQVYWPWSTAPLTGDHMLEVTVTDPFGRGATVEQLVTLGDIPFATAIEVVNTTDSGGFSDLEIEIHLEDADSGAHIGCAGAGSGLVDVDQSGTTYPVMAWFTDTTGATLPMATLAGRNIGIHVMEDDSFPCPAAIDVGTDDIVGTSAPMPAESLAGSAPMSFGNVADLEIDAGRPFQR